MPPIGPPLLHPLLSSHTSISFLQTNKPTHRKMATAPAPPATATTAAATDVEGDREAAIAGLKAKAQLRGMLKSTLRVTLSDGRVVTGEYQVCGWRVGGLWMDVPHACVYVCICVYNTTHSDPYIYSFIRPLNTQCMDEHLNLILQHAVERRTVKTTEGAGGEEGCVCDDGGMCMYVYYILYICCVCRRPYSKQNKNDNNHHPQPRGGAMPPTTTSRQQTRQLGLVMCPGEHVVKVEVKERDPLEITLDG